MVWEYSVGVGKKLWVKIDWMSKKKVKSILLKINRDEINKITKINKI